MQSSTFFISIRPIQFVIPSVFQYLDRLGVEQVLEWNKVNFDRI